MGSADELRNIRRDARRGDPAEARLRMPANPPRDSSRFTPDLYPSGMPLEPAAGPPATDEQIEASFVTFLRTHLGSNQARIDATIAKFRDPEVALVLPDAGVRAGLLSITGTLGDPFIDPFLAGELAVNRLTYGEPIEAGLVVGRAAGAPLSERVVNRRYQAEPFALLAGSLLHELLRHEPVVSDDEETMLYALAAAVHLQMISRTPALAGTSELARRQNSIALALLCSRSAGSSTVRLIAPDGPGLVPQGPLDRSASDVLASDASPPDFWSLSFVPGLAGVVAPTAAFGLLLESLLVSDPSDHRAVRVDQRLAERLDEQVFTRELRPDELVRAGIALTVFAGDAGVARAAS
jgi:hypothetical protein